MDRLVANLENKVPLADTAPALPAATATHLHHQCHCSGRPWAAGCQRHGEGPPGATCSSPRTPDFFSNSIYRPHLLHTSHPSMCPHAGPASQTRACLIHLDHLNHLNPFRSAVRSQCRACLPVHRWWSCSTARSSADGSWSGRRGGRGGRNAHGGNNLHRGEQRGGECTLASVVTVKQAIGVGNPADGALPNRGILQSDV